MTKLHVESLPVGAIQANCHIICRGADALVVDPGGDAERIIAFLRENRLTPAAYLITHGHFDHVHALADVFAAFPAPVGMHEADRVWAFTSAMNSYEPYYAIPRPPPEFARAWRGGQTWTDAGLAYEIIETPGHSPGSVSFHFPAEKMVFSGDVLFAGGVGRTDLPGGDAPTLFKSLRRLLELPGETAVYSGHGPATTIAREKRGNPFLLDPSWAGGAFGKT